MPGLPVIPKAALDALERRFFALFEGDVGGFGAAVSVWQGDSEVLGLASGTASSPVVSRDPWAWDRETLVPVWSCSKGPASAACLLALQQHDVSLEATVASIWPEFAQGGKAEIRVRDLLSHSAGLPALESPRPAVTEYSAVVAALEHQVPLWTPGTAHGYHPRTFGFLVDELVRRVSGASSLGHYWREELAEPLGFDIWIGLPKSEHNRVAEVFSDRSRRGVDVDAREDGSGADSQAEERAFYRTLGDRESLTARAFGSPVGLHSVAAMNDPGVWGAGYPAFGGVASASGLAAFHAFLANGGSCAGSRFFSPSMLQAMESTWVQGDDRVLLRETAFGPGFMKDPVDESGRRRRRLFGPSARAFGHPGAGGSVAFADPENGIGFAYVMNAMARAVLPTQEIRQLVACLYGRDE